MINQVNKFKITKHIYGKMNKENVETGKRSDYIEYNDHYNMVLYSKSISVDKIIQWINKIVKDYKRYMKIKTIESQLLLSISYQNELIVESSNFESTATFENSYLPNYDEIIGKAIAYDGKDNEIEVGKVEAYFLEVENLKEPVWELLDIISSDHEGYAKYFDSILFISTPKSIRIQRIRKRKNIPDDQIEKRMAMQMSESRKQELAHTTIENNKDVQALYIKLEEFYKNLNL